MRIETQVDDKLLGLLDEIAQRLQRDRGSCIQEAIADWVGFQERLGVLDWRERDVEDHIRWLKTMQSHGR